MPSHTPGFTTRTVYCCDACGLEVKCQQEILQHLAEYHKDAAAISHGLEEAAPQQQDNVTSSVYSKPLACPHCGRIYKYLRCFERHVEQHTTATQLTSPKTVSELQHTNVHTASQSVIDSSHAEQKLRDGKDNSACVPLSDIDQLELQVVTDVHDDVLVLTEVIDNQLEKKVQRSQTAPYCCPECPEQFFTRKSFRLHVNDKHAGLCDQLFSKGCEDRSHRISAHKVPGDDNVKLVKPVLNSQHCLVCGLHFWSKEELAKHMTCHDDAIPAFACPLCSGRYHTKHGLNRHVQQIHTGDHPHHCELCGDRFATGEEKNLHVKQHSPNLCTACGVRLRRQSCSGAVTCSVCYLEQLSSRDGVQIAEKVVVANSETQNHSQASSLPLKYCCGTCGVRFAWRSNLRRHEHRHTAHSRVSAKYVQHNEAKHFQCSYCGRVFSQANGLRKHILRHVEPTEMPQPSFSCQLCGQQFSWKKSLIRHLRMAHPPSPARRCIPVIASTSHQLPCDSAAGSSASSSEIDPVTLNSSEEHDKCGEQFKLLAACYPHNVQNGEKMPTKDDVQLGKSRRMHVQCPECGAAFFWRSNLLRHIRQKHQTDTTSDSHGSSEKEHLQCNRCGRRFSRLFFLRMHLQAHENAEKCGDVDNTGVCSDPLLCSQCGQKTHKASQLRVHMLRHAGIRPHQCRLCDRSFYIAAQLKQHVAVVHQGLRVICDQCGHKANSKSSLKVHCRSAHPAPGVKPLFPCSVCSRSFWSKAALQRHSEAHDLSRLSKRKSMCSVCGMLFRHVYNLTHHIQTTHADADCTMPYACATCNQQFDSGLAFRTHYRSKHRNR